VKTTIDLPADIVRAMKIKAAKENRKLKEVAAELLREGLKPSAYSLKGVSSKRASVFRKQPKTGHPIVQTSKKEGGASLSVEETYRLIQETQTAEDLEKIGFSL